MRVRKRAGAKELIEAHPQYVVAEPIEWKGRWHERLAMIIRAHRDRHGKRSIYYGNGESSSRNQLYWGRCRSVSFRSHWIK